MSLLRTAFVLVGPIGGRVFALKGSVAGTGSASTTTEKDGKQ